MAASFSLKTKILMGTRGWEDLNLSAQRVFIATDKMMRDMGICSLVSDLLDKKGIPYDIFDEIEPDPSFDTVQKGVAHLLRKESDMIIAVGGGSVIDAAKAFLFFALKASQKMGGLTQRKPIFVAVPTTSGTGSEVTAYSVVTDVQNGVKIPLVSDDIIPDIAVLDPRFTLSCPPKVTAATGFDVLTHVLESYVSLHSNHFTEALCEKVTALVFQNLKKVYTQGKDEEARLLMHEASCLAGIAFTNSGLGLNHALAHSLGGRLGIPHGRANALFMPHVIAFNSKAVGGRYAALAHTLDLPSKNNTEGTVSLITAIVSLCQDVDIPLSILDYGISREEYLALVPAMSQAALKDPCLGTTPLRPTLEDIERLYKALI